MICISTYQIENHIGGVMSDVLSSSAVDRGFESLSGETKYYKIGIVASPLSRYARSINEIEQRLVGLESG
jgi:hypothetical protein